MIILVSDFPVRDSIHRHFEVLSLKRTSSIMIETASSCHNLRWRMCEAGKSIDLHR